MTDPTLNPRQKQAEEVIGQTIGGIYEIESLIAPGGMSNVYKAKHTRLNRPCAVKIMLPQACQDPNLMARFKREAKIVGKLVHPNICSVYEYLLDKSGYPIIVMEYLEGIPIDQWIDQNEFLSPVNSVFITMSVLQALAFAHKKDIVHRDIKPGNIIALGDIAGDYYIKLLDFGIAKNLNQNTMSAELTRTGEVFGTPLYLSPEQCLDEKIDSRADIYSVGCLLYTMLVGMPPFIDTNPIEVMKMHLSKPIDMSQTSIKPSLRELIEKATHKKKDERFQSAEEFYDALKKNEFCRKKVT